MSSSREDVTLEARAALAGARSSLKTLARVAKTALRDAALAGEAVGRLEQELDALELETSREAGRGESTNEQHGHARAA